jgi:hypothetical protein
MSDGLVGCCGKQQHFPNGETFSELEELGFRNQIPVRRRLAQKIDAEIGVTASPTGPIADNSTMYIAVSAKVISAGPETVPPGRSMLS